MSFSTVQILETVYQKFIAVLDQEGDVVQGFKQDLQMPRLALSFLKAFITGAQEELNHKDIYKDWLQKVETLAYEADAVLDELKYHLLRREVKYAKRKVNRVTSLISSSHFIFFRKRMALKIREIGSLADNLWDGPQIDIIKESPDHSFPPIRELATSSIFDPMIFGLENDILEMVKTLSDPPTVGTVSVVPIVGMGAVGKTTLARVLFNHQDIKYRFAKRIWVSVSRKLYFKTDVILETILEALEGEHVNVQPSSFEYEVTVEKIQNHIQNSRYLLVLDDVWYLDEWIWKHFMDYLSKFSSAQGNVIVVTTRSQRVAATVATLPTKHLHLLSQDNCLSIIEAVAFQESRSIPIEFETVGTCLAERCQGLPIAAKIIGGMLRNKDSSCWGSILNTPFSNLPHFEPLVLSLKVSFDELRTSSLKKCFIYCSILPKGKRIDREQLIELWMAEECLEADSGTDDVECTGNNIFNYLLESCLFHDVERDEYGNIKSCKMHDLVHNVACVVSNSKSWMVYGGSICIHQGRHIAIHNDTIPNEEAKSIPNEEAKFIRTLFFYGKVQNNMFSSFKRLHTLNLAHADIDKLPTIVGKLIYLRYLDLSYTRIRRLKGSICKLYNLQTLWIIGMKFLEKLPKNLNYLVSLRHLHVSSIKLPPEVGKLTALRTLPYYEVGYDKGHGIEELKTLKNLGGELEIRNLERVKDEEESRNANLCDKKDIFALRFVWGESREDEVNDENVLNGLQPHPNLKGLEVYGFKGRKLAIWTMKMVVHNAIEGHWYRLNNLMHLRLANCSECEEIPMMGHLPQLKSVYLIGLTSVRSISSSFYGIEDLTTSSDSTQEATALFPLLARMELLNMPNLREWLDPEVATVVFPCLEYLKIDGCPQLMYFPHHIPSIKRLIDRGDVSGSQNFAQYQESSVSVGKNVAETIIRDDDYERKQQMAASGKETFVQSSPLESIVSSEALPNAALTSVLPAEITEVFMRSKFRNTSSLNQQAFEFSTEKAKPSGVGLAGWAENESTSNSDIEVVEPGTRIRIQKQRDTISPVDQMKPDAQLSDQHQESRKLRDDIQNPDFTHTSDYRHGSANTDESISITISATGELNNYADLELKIADSYLQEVQHPDRDSSNLDLDQEKEDYFFLVKRNSTNQGLDCETITMGDHPSSAGWLNYQLSGVLPPGCLIYKSGGGLPTIEEWSRACVVSLTEIDHLVSLPDRPDCPNLVVLFLQNENRLLNIPPSFFDNMPALRFLGLSGMRNRSLPTSLFSRAELQGLLLKNNVRLVRLPIEIAKLDHIEVLDLSGTELYDLPDQVGQLTRLKGLRLSFYGPDDENEYADLPSELVCRGTLSKLQDLEALSIFVHPEDHRWRKMSGHMTHDIVTLKKIRHLRFYFPKIENLENFIQESPAWNNNIIKTFKFVVGHDVKRIGSRVPNEVELKYDQLERCLRFVNGDDFPQVIGKVLERATAFCLDHHIQVCSLSQFGVSNLREIKFCVVRECANIQMIMDEEENNCAMLPSLEYLGIHYLWNLKHIWNPNRTPSKSFCSLKYLTVCTCHRLEFILPVSMFSCLSMLEELVVEDCEAVTRITGGEREIENVTLLPRLGKVELRYLPHLEHLGNGLHLTDDKITVYKCPNLCWNNCEEVSMTMNKYKSCSKSEQQKSCIEMQLNSAKLTAEEHGKKRVKESGVFTSKNVSNKICKTAEKSCKSILKKGKAALRNETLKKNMTTLKKKTLKKVNATW